MVSFGDIAPGSEVLFELVDQATLPPVSETGGDDAMRLKVTADQQTVIKVINPTRKELFNWERINPVAREIGVPFSGWISQLSDGTEMLVFATRRIYPFMDLASELGKQLSGHDDLDPAQYILPLFEMKIHAQMRALQQGGYVVDMDPINWGLYKNSVVLFDFGQIDQMSEDEVKTLVSTMPTTAEILAQIPSTSANDSAAKPLTQGKSIAQMSPSEKFEFYRITDLGRVAEIPGLSASDILRIQEGIMSFYGRYQSAILQGREIGPLMGRNSFESFDNECAALRTDKIQDEVCGYVAQLKVEGKFRHFEKTLA